MVAGDVGGWSECLPDLFEHGSVELEFVQALAEEPFKEIDVRCPAYAEILSKLVDVSELVDFGSSVGRRGHYELQALLRRKQTVAEVKEWLPVDCDTREDREMGYQDVYLACNNTEFFRDARWFNNFDWRCKMFAWHQFPWITATPVALFDLSNHYLMFHCEWIRKQGAMRSDGYKETVTDEAWTGVWRVVEWMLLVIWSGNHYKNKPIWVCAGTMCGGLDRAVTQMRKYEWNSTDDGGKPSWTVCDARSRPIPSHDSGYGVDGGVGLDTELVHAQKCKEVWRQLNGSASLYRNTVVQALLNVEEDHGYYWEEGQQPYRWEVGQEVYSARHGWTATLASGPKNGSVLLKDKEMGAANSNASVVHKSTKRDKPTGMKEAQLVIAPLKRTSAVRMPSAGER